MAVAKKAVKRAAKPAPKKAGRPRAAASTPRSRSPRAERPATVFNVNPAMEQHQLTPGSVELYVNGQSKGITPTRGQNLRRFVTEQAQYYGIRTFSVYLDGSKATTAQGEAAIPDSTRKLELVAKDARGAGRGEAGEAVEVKQALPPELEQRLMEFALSLPHHLRPDFWQLLSDMATLGATTMFSKLLPELAKRSQ